jgi:hypothetical protein
VIRDVARGLGATDTLNARIAVAHPFGECQRSGNKMLLATFGCGAGITRRSQLRLSRIAKGDGCRLEYFKMRWMIRTT